MKLNLLTHGKLSGDSSNSEDVFLRRKYAEIIKERVRAFHRSLLRQPAVL